MLSRDPDTGASVALIKFDKGAGIPQPDCMPRIVLVRGIFASLGVDDAFPACWRIRSSVRISKVASHGVISFALIADGLRLC